MSRFVPKLRPVPDTPRRMVAYVRQSVAREESISPEVQERACRDYIAAQGDVVVAVISDVGVSGLKWDRRPGIQKAMGMIPNLADGIVVWRWSRLSRSRLHQAVALDAVERAGGVIESATEPFDQTTAGGRFGRDVMLAAAAFESQQKGEQWADAHRRRQEKGLPPSGGRRFGYISGHESYTVDPDTGPILAECYQRYLSGQGLQQVADWLNALGLSSPRAGANRWSKRGVTYMLDAGFGAGLIRGGGQLLPGTHEAVIDDQTWRRYVAERQRRRVVAPRLLHPTTRLGGVVLCGHCHSIMSTKTVEAVGSHYRCTSRGCDGRPFLRRIEVEAAVLRWLPGVAGEVQQRASRFPRAVVESERSRLARQVARADKALQTLLVDRAKTRIPAAVFEASVAELMGERDRAQQMLDRAESRSAGLDGAAEAAESLAAAWDTADVQQVNAVCRLLLRVTVRRVTFGVKGTPAVHRVTPVGVWDCDV